MSTMISIIIPVYNVNNQLHYCIESILNQRYNDFELILVDDGSTDGSAEMCDVYARKYSQIRVIHKKNGGVSNARNIGMDVAQGEFICFVDSDDFINEEYLKLLIDTKKSFRYCDNIWCGMQTVKGYHSESIQKFVYSENKLVSFLSVKEIMSLHEKWLDAGPYCKLFSRRIIQSNNLRFQSSVSLGEDLLFNYEYLDKTNGKIVVINRAPYNYVQFNPKSLSSRYYPNLFDLYKYINNCLLHYINKWNCNEEQKQIFYNYCFFAYEKALRNTYHPCSSIKRKNQYNNNILRSSEFTKSFASSNCYIHPFFRFAYKHHSYFLVRFLEFIRSKKKVRKV